MASQSHNLLQPAPYTVTNHGAADPLADREPKATKPQRIGRNAQHNQTMGPALSLAAGSVELTAPAQPINPFQGLPGPLSIGNRGSQTLTAAQTPPFDDVAPVAGAHALTEAVNTKPPAYFRLKSSFWHRKDRTPFFSRTLSLPQGQRVCIFAGRRKQQKNGRGLDLLLTRVFATVARMGCVCC